MFIETDIHHPSISSVYRRVCGGGDGKPQVRTIQLVLILAHLMSKYMLTNPNMFSCPSHESQADDDGSDLKKTRKLYSLYSMFLFFSFRILFVCSKTGNPLLIQMIFTIKNWTRERETINTCCERPEKHRELYTLWRKIFHQNLAVALEIHRERNDTNTELKN